MPLPAAHDALLSFRAPALRSAQVWRVICVVAGFEVAFSLTPAILGPFVDWSWPDALLEVLNYAGFGVTLAALWLLVWLLHRRGPASLMGSLPAVLRDGARVLLAVGLVLLVQQPFDLGGIDGDLRLAPVGGWLFWLGPALLAITLQVATEEIYFRGYLTQQLAAISTQRRVWLVLPSVYFGTSHLLNGDGMAEGALWAVWATLLGAACADLTARTGNLGAAIGLHLGNNVFAALLLGYVGMPGHGLALFLLPAADYIPMTAGLGDLVSAWTVLDIAYSILSVGVMWLAARVAIRA
jgi:uncharacterized protein